MKHLSCAFLATSSLAALLLSSCSMHPSRIEVPSLDPDGAGREALGRYDTNGNGNIDAEELKSVPGLNAGKNLLDADKDGAITAAEIAARLRKYQTSRIGLSQVQGAVYLDKAPVEGATIRFIPETFMGTSVEEAIATSDQYGMFKPQIQGMKIAGMQSGIYRIEVSKKNSQGQELIPEKYNSHTTVGLELGPDSPVAANGISIEMRSK